MNQAEFTRLGAQGYNRVPLTREVMADLDTPLSTYLKLAKGPFSYLFESVHGGEKWGRYSIIGLPCKEILKVYGDKVTLTRNGNVVDEQTICDPLVYVDQYKNQFKAVELDDLPRFNGGLVGYFGYDTVRYIEPKLKASVPQDDLNNPDILLMLSDEVLVFDNLKGKIICVVHADPAQNNAFDNAHKRLDEIVKGLRDNPVAPEKYQASKTVMESDFTSDFGRHGISGEERFKDVVDSIKEYVMAGDVMQTVVSQRLQADYDAPPLDLYRALRSLNPSPYMYFLELDDFHIVGSSPEILARLEDDEVTVRPIAGTRYRGATPEQDKALEEELLADPKEIAEHLMLIDLGRNDAGRISKTGSVKLTDKMVVERYSHVMHIVSNVTGVIKDGKTAMDVLRATHPAGTLSGAPKIRAMEIIDEFEPVKRGIYGGAVGYLSFNGNMDMAIAIRTAVIKNKKIYVQAGAGVVADSIPRLELKETQNKARAIFKATELATSGIDKE